LRIFADCPGKPCQTKIRFGRGRAADGGGKFVHTSVKPLRDKEPRQKIFQMRAIDLAEFLHGHNPFEKAVFTKPGMPNAGAFALLRAAQHEVSAPGHIEVPRNETELVRFGVEVEIKVLAVGEQTVVAAE